MARCNGGGALSAASRIEPAARQAAQPDGCGAGERAGEGGGPRSAGDKPGRRAIAAGDVVRVFNARGACFAGAMVTDTVRPGVVRLSCGAWYDPASDAAD